jgi:hypothetical protein
MRATLFFALLLGACSGQKDPDVDRAPRPDTIVDSVEIDTLPARYDGKATRSGEFPVSLAAFRAAAAAPGDSLKIGITPYLPSDTAGIVWNSKIEQALGARAVNYTGPWNLLGAHSNLPPTVKRDSFFVARPPSGVTWTYRGCVQTARSGATPSAWKCKVFTYTRPVVSPPPPDSVIVDSNAIRVARIFITPPVLDVAAGTSACASLSDAESWKDVGQTQPVDDCMGQVRLASGAIVLRPMRVKMCSYAQTLDGRWHLTTNSATERRCQNELARVVDGSVVGANFGPGEDVWIDLVKVASR